MEPEDAHQEALSRCQEGGDYLLSRLEQECAASGASFFVIAGTLLGAYRHSGWIPWDDDIDVGMLRSDYEALKSHMRKVRPQDVYLSDPRDSPHHGPNQFPELVLRTSSINGASGHVDDTTVRVTLDIFVYDHSPKSEVVRRAWIVGGLMLRRIASNIRRAAPLGIPLADRDSLAAQTRLALGKAFYVYLAIPGILGRESSGCVSCVSLPRSLAMTSLWLDEVLPLTYLRFGKRLVPAPGNGRYLLEQWYGNYQNLPPVSERFQHGVKSAQVWYREESNAPNRKGRI